MKCTSRSNSLCRIDYYYADNALFEEVNASSNTPTTTTINYVSAPPLDRADPDIVVGYDISPVNSNYTVTCLGSELWRILKYSYGQQTDSEGNATNKVIIPVIHKWSVERCVP